MYSTATIFYSSFVFFVFLFYVTLVLFVLFVFFVTRVISFEKQISFVATFLSNCKAKFRTELESKLIVIVKVFFLGQLEFERDFFGSSCSDFPKQTLFQSCIKQFFFSVFARSVLEHEVVIKR